MEPKKNTFAHLQLTSKSNPLIQPLISISKASTPIRTRVIASNPINSTPINISKITGLDPKSGYRNKENTKPNHILLESSIKKIHPSHYPSKLEHNFLRENTNINLSPILALNRKLHNPNNKINSSRALTPPPFYQKPNQYQVEEEEEDEGSLPHQDQRYQTLNFSKGSHQASIFGNRENHGHNASNHMNNPPMRASNSFQNLLESKSKVQINQFNFNTSPIYRTQTSPKANLLKESTGSNPFFQHFAKNSKSKLIESRSIDRVKNVISPKNEDSSIFCMNNDGKKAKYKVINRDEDEDSMENEEEHFYCSKCTIFLVKQGFVVEQISNKDCIFEKTQISGHSPIASPMPKYSGVSTPSQESEEQKRQSVFLKQQVRQKVEFFKLEYEQCETNMNKKMEDIDCYYNSIIEYMEGERIKDRERLITFKNEIKVQPEKYIDQMERSLDLLDSLHKSQNYFKIKNALSEIQSLLKVDSTNLIPKHSLSKSYDIQQSIDSFATLFEEDLRPHFQIQSINSKTRPNHNNGQDQSKNANNLRFSFEKALTHPSMHRNGLKTEMNALEEEQQEDGEYDQEDDQKDSQGSDDQGYGKGYDKKEPIVYEQRAFRNLFPEDENEEEGQLKKNDIQSPTFKQF